MRRIVSIWLKNFPIDRFLWQMRQSKNHTPLHQPSTSCTNALHPAETQPFAFVQKQTRGVRIFALNRQARQNGLYKDMRLSDARALVPFLATQFAEPDKDAGALVKLAHWCERYTPLVSLDEPDGLWLDITGAAHLHGDENGLLADLDKRLSAIGFAHGLSAAPTPGAAWALARFAQHDNANRQKNPVIQFADLSSALDRLPLEALRLDENALYWLNRFGLKTIGALYALPRASLKRRFPSKDLFEAVLHRLDQALARAAEPLTPLKEEPVFVERLSFAEPILATASFHLGLRDLLKPLTARMQQEAKGATRLTFSACHADGGMSQVTVATARPSRDGDHFARLFRDRVETLDPGFGVDMLILSADAVEPLQAGQTGFYIRSGHAAEQDDVYALIDRLSNRLATHHVQRIVFQESHVPERAEKSVPVLQEHKADLQSLGSQSPDNKPQRPSRLLARPEPVQVIAEVPEGSPVRFVWRRVAYRVMRAEGPERIAPEWWRTKAGVQTTAERTRDYYRIEDEQGRRFWLFREGLYRDTDSSLQPSWYMHGLFA